VLSDHSSSLSDSADDPFLSTRKSSPSHIRSSLIVSGIFMFITLLVVGCLGAVAGQGDAFEPYLREHKAFGKAVAAMICLYGEFDSYSEKV
jgi:hypothetical protein